MTMDSRQRDCPELPRGVSTPYQAGQPLQRSPILGKYSHTKGFNPLPIGAAMATCDAVTYLVEIDGFQSPTNRGGHGDSDEFAPSTQVQFTHKIP